MGRRSARAASAGRGVAGVACVLIAALVTGCVTRRIPSEELPEEPIAFLHWEDKAARKRSEAFAARAELPAAPEDKFDPEGAEEREIVAHLRGEYSAMLAARLAARPGRLMVYWPRTEVVERVDAAPINSRPLAWSRDHKRLLFVSSHREGRRQLYEYDFERKHLSTLTFGTAEHVRGDYTLNGRLVVLRVRSPSRRGRSERSVHLASAGGRMGKAVARDVYPGTLRVLPEGDAIVYEQVVPRPRRDGPTIFDSFIAVRRLEEGAEEQLLIRGREPALTPDGEWIVFASESSAGYRLRRMRPDGTSRVAISSGLSSGPAGVEERMPTVSPDGDYVAFIADGGDSRRLVVRRFDGKLERDLVTSGWSEFPVW